MIMSNTLYVRTLGEFTFEYNGKILDDRRSKKLWMLMGYLLTFRKGSVSQDELIELLWPNEDTADPINSLKAIVHRSRALLSQIGVDGKKLIAYRQGGYIWNPDGFNAIIDDDIFETACADAEKATDSDAKLAHLSRALETYNGSYLPLAALEQWAVPISTYYHTKYIAAATEAVALLEQRKNYEEIITICQKAVVIDPYQEGLHISFIRALSNIGQAQTAVAQYERVTELFYAQFGVTPSAELTSLYREIKKSISADEVDVASVETMLQERPTPHEPGAFLCELEVFKDIYRLELRAQERIGHVFCLSLLTVTTHSNSRPAQSLLRPAMDKVAAAIKTSLRQNDVFTRISVSQYLMLLSGTTLENAELALSRIVKRFRIDNPRMAVSLQYRLRPVSAAGTSPESFIPGT